MALALSPRRLLGKAHIGPIIANLRRRLRAPCRQEPPDGGGNDISVRIDPPIKRRRLAPLALAGLIAGIVVLAPAGGAPAQDLQSQLDQKRAQLDNAKSQEGVLSTTIQRYSDQIDTLAGQVATLRNREAAVQADLDAAAVELRQDKRRLSELRVRLAHSLKVLRQRLVAMYRSSAPDIVSVILDSKGFDDLISRYQYLRNIEDQDTKIVG